MRRGGLHHGCGVSVRRLAAAAAVLLWVSAFPIAPVLAQNGALGIAITSPKNEETIHDNTGSVPVSIAMQGSGLPEHSSIRVLLDGRPYGAARYGASFTLEGVERGEHTLQAQVVDAAGKTILSSDTVTFYMWQASRLFPGRK